jgi:integrase
MLTWAADAEMLTAVNLPSSKHSTAKITPRSRVVSDDEIRQIWAATEALEPRQQAFAKFLFMSAVRSGAAALARREWIDGQAIRFPGSTHGVKRRAERRDQDHNVALNEWAWDQIAPAIQGESTLLFTDGRVPIRPARVLATLRTACGIADWEWHDLRRSFRTWAARSGVQPDAAEAALGHVIHRDEVAKAYQKHRFEAEAAAALHSWQNHVRELVEGPIASNVVTMKR